MPGNCIVLLGGSFDPVHNGHLAISSYFCQLLGTRKLRIIPAGNPWQKPPLKASPQQRIDMLQLAFRSQNLSITIDQQEINRKGASYTIDTLKAIRQEIGVAVSLVFIMGIDQLIQLHTWREWKKLFNYANICTATRPDFSFSPETMPRDLQKEFLGRLATPQEVEATSHGLTYIAHDLAVDVSSTKIRAAFQQSEKPYTLVPAEVLDYIERNNLYRK